MADNTTLTTGNTLPPPQSPFVDPSTGVLSNDGYLYILGLINQLIAAIPTAGLAVGLTATGLTQATALLLSKQWNVISAASNANAGVLLSAFQPGQNQVVFNQSGVTIDVYPPPDFAIDAEAANQPYSLANGKMQIFNFESSTQIKSTQLG
jgi:hypothetical protein